MAGLELKAVTKAYADAFQVIHGVDLSIDDGEFVVFVGPSGCGKSTLLRMIAGLEDLSSGTISIGERIVNDVAPSRRGVAMVFQTYALYPHMSVYDNMAFGLKQAKMNRDAIDGRIRSAAEVLQITDYLTRSPRHLSGGQRQRVAIGRAIVREPDVFLFDEPLSNLDAALRVQTRIEIARLHERLKTTMIYVTHDQVEAMTLADKIVVLQGGLIEQVGSPMTLYERPSNRFVAQFIGSPKMNLFSIETLTKGSGGLDWPSGSIEMGVRPEHLTPCESGDGFVSGSLDLVEPMGEYALVHLREGEDCSFTVKMPRPPECSRGSTMHFRSEMTHVHYFDKSGARVEADLGS